MLKILLGLVLLSGGVGKGYADSNTVKRNADFGNLWNDFSRRISGFGQQVDDWVGHFGEEVTPAIRKIEDVVDSVAASSIFKVKSVDGHSIDEDDTENSVPQNASPNQNLFRIIFGNPTSIFGQPTPKWYHGPNVCKDTKVILDDGKEEVEKKINEESEEEEEILRHKKKANFFISGINFKSNVTSCKDTPTLHECTTIIRDSTVGQKIVINKIECCYGYTRQENTLASLGCEKFEMKPLKETMEEIQEAGEFLLLLSMAGLENIVFNENNNLTIFVPSNEAVEDFGQDMEQHNTLEFGEAIDTDKEVTYYVEKPLESEEILKSSQFSDIYLNHIVGGFLDTNNMKDEDVISVFGSSDKKIYLQVYNTYPERVIMANCARIISRNNYATNGVVHIVDKVMPPVTQSLADIVRQNLDLMKLKDVLDGLGIMKDLEESEGVFTLFAPTNNAFEKIDETLWDKLVKGEGCATDIIRNHILNNIMCSGIAEETKFDVWNTLGNRLIMEGNKEGDVFIDGKKIVFKDIVATNGVIHLIDDMLIPEEFSRDLTTALKATNRNGLLELFESAGLTEELESMSDITLFGPSETALEGIDELNEDPEALRNSLLFHVVTPKTCMCDLRDGMLLNTKLEGKTIRIDVYVDRQATFGLIGVNERPVITAQCVRLNTVDTNFCQGTIHTVERILKPSEESMLKIISSRAEFSQFNNLIDIAGLRDNLVGRLGQNLKTIFVPTDASFDLLDEETREKIFEDEELASMIVLGHILPENLCCAGIPRVNPFFNPLTKVSASSEVVSIQKSRRGKIYIDNAEVNQCDMVADDGVVHSIDSVLLPHFLRKATVGSNALRIWGPFGKFLSMVQI